jgi:hypothetical protein
MGPICCPETSIRNYSLRNDPEERGFNLMTLPVLRFILAICLLLKKDCGKTWIQPPDPITFIAIKHTHNPHKSAWFPLILPFLLKWRWAETPSSYLNTCLYGVGYLRKLSIDKTVQFRWQNNEWVWSFRRLTLTGKKYDTRKKTLSQCHSVQQKSQMESPGFELVPWRRKAGD